MPRLRSAHPLSTGTVVTFAISKPPQIANRSNTPDNTTDAACCQPPRRAFSSEHGVWNWRFLSSKREECGVSSRHPWSCWS